MNLEATLGWQEKVLIVDEVHQLPLIDCRAPVRFPARCMTEIAILNLQDPCTFRYSYFTDEKAEDQRG